MAAAKKEETSVNDKLKALQAALGKIEKDFYGRVDTPWKLVNNKVIVASDDEQQTNPRSRSAKLRIAERLHNNETEK